MDINREKVNPEEPNPRKGGFTSLTRTDKVTATLMALNRLIFHHPRKDTQCFDLKSRQYKDQLEISLQDHGQFLFSYTEHQQDFHKYPSLLSFKCNHLRF